MSRKKSASSDVIDVTKGWWCQDDLQCLQDATGVIVDNNFGGPISEERIIKFASEILHYHAGEVDFVPSVLAALARLEFECIWDDPDWADIELPYVLELGRIYLSHSQALAAELKKANEIYSEKWTAAADADRNKDKPAIVAMMKEKIALGEGKGTQEVRGND